MKSREEIIMEIEEMAGRMRKNALDMALAAGASSSHFGSGLSIIEITATLYGAIMRYDRKDPEWSERDRFILSKGHGVLGYYTALAEAGYVPVEDLDIREDGELSRRTPCYKQGEGDRVFEWQPWHGPFAWHRGRHCRETQGKLIQGVCSYGGRRVQ